MNNLHRTLAPISAAAWAEIDEEACRTFKRSIAGRRVVDVTGPSGPTLAAIGTGHLAAVEAPVDGVQARLYTAQPVVRLRVPFRVSREAVDDVERGARDSDWQPVKDAVQTMALAEDRAIFHGATAAGIRGIGPGSSHEVLPLPADVRDLIDVVAKGLTRLGLAGVDGPYALLLGADLFTAVSEITDHGFPVREHINRLISGDIVWAPALEGALLLSVRGGDFELHLGQDLSIGYLSHDADTIELYCQESMTFVSHTDEASIVIR